MPIKGWYCSQEGETRPGKRALFQMQSCPLDFLLFFFSTRPGLLPVLGPLGSVQTPHTNQGIQPGPALRLLGYLYERAAL